MMKTCAALTVAVAAAALATAAPVPQSSERPTERWEYGELTFVPAGRQIRVAPPQAGFPVPTLGAAKAAWMTGGEEVEAESWEALAAKLWVADGPKSDNPAVYKLRVLNYLGRQGWEMVSAVQPTSPLGTTVSTFVFKRKAK
jgi:hypothetical protein